MAAAEKEEDKEPAEGDLLEGGEEGKKSKKKLLLILIPVLLLVGGGAGLYFSGLLDGLLGKKADTEETAEGAEGEHGEAAAEGEHGEKKAEAEHGKEAKSEGKEAKGGHGEKKGGGEHGKGGEGGEHAVDPNAIAFLEMPDIIVNLNSDSGKPQFLRLSVQLEMANQADLEAVQAIMPRVVDQFQTYLRELRTQDIRGSKGMYRLQQELLIRVNNAAAPVEVKDVLFQEILIQ